MKIIKAFTLVELLVVLAILSILSAFIMGGFRGSQQKGRDAERKSDLKQIANAIESYYSDHGKYPDSLPWGGELKDVNNTIYIKVVPEDSAGNLNYVYMVPDSPKNQKYQLYAFLENSQDKNLDPDIVLKGISCGEICNFGISSTNTTPTE